MKKFLAFFLMLLPLAIASCGSDEPQTNTTKDPDGTILVNIKVDDYTYADGCGIELLEDFNFMECSSESKSISIVGPVKGIGNINVTSSQVNSMVWTDRAAAIVGYGYIFKIYNHAKYNESLGKSEYFYDYYAVYVSSEIVSTSGGVIGFTLKVRKILENIKEN